MPHRILLATALAAVALGGASPAVADPEPAPPPIPNAFAYPPVNPAN